MSSAEPRVPNPRVPDDPVTRLPATTLMQTDSLQTDHPDGPCARHALRTSQRHARALLRADQRRIRADQRAGVEVDRRLPDRARGCPRPETVTAHHERLSAVITEQVTAGATVHRRLPWAARYLPPVVALMNGIVLFSFCADVVDVGHARPVPVAILVAAVLALLGSGIAYAWLAVAGLRVRSYRNALGEVEWAATRSLTRGMMAIAGVVILALAVLMNARVGAELTGSGLTPAAAGLTGAVFAVLSAVANLTVMIVPALDGSDAAADLRHTGRLLNRRERRVTRRLRTTQRRAQREDRVALRGHQHAERRRLRGSTPG